MKKYYIGLLVIALMTLGLTGFVLVQAASSKQDTETSRKAQDVADKLNNYVASKGVPESLGEANIKDVPSTITYSKTAEDKYEFCVTYKHASDGFDGGGFSQVLTGAFQRNLQDYPTDSSSSYAASSLYLSYTHKAGKDCQTVQAYSYNLNSPAIEQPYNPSQSTYDFGGSAGLSTSASDVERQADINALHGQIEAYYAQNGYYPSLTNMNDGNWRKTNMKGLDNEALRDPKGTAFTLVNTPAKNNYGYTVESNTGKSCENAANLCAVYTLTATLDNGTTYSKYNLN